MGGGQFLFPGDECRLGDGGAVQPVQQGGEVVDVLADGGRGALLLPQMGGVPADVAGGEVTGLVFHNGILLGK